VCPVASHKLGVLSVPHMWLRLASSLLSGRLTRVAQLASTFTLRPKRAVFAPHRKAVAFCPATGRPALLRIRLALPAGCL
jgi:hypothetical protein